MLSDSHTSIYVHHNIEVAHRLLNLPGKCQQIHGHSMWVTLSIDAEKDSNGYALGPDGTPLDFGSVKKFFRAYLDGVWDHRLHLNEGDPWAGTLYATARDEKGQFDEDGFMGILPGLQTWPADPSVENIAMWIRNQMAKQLQGMSIFVTVDETKTNGAGA